MSDRVTLLVRLLLVLAAAPAAAQEPPAAQLDALFAAWDRDDSPGCCLGVIRAGELVYARGYGMADLEQGTPFTPRSVTPLASASKQFTAMAVLLLAEGGALSLDDDVRRFVPELPDHGAPVRLRHLLAHTSGLRDHTMLLQYRGMAPWEHLSKDETLDLIARQRSLNALPGAAFRYCNSGYWLLALVAERASGSSFAAFAQDRIFGPLGMAHTRVQEEFRALVPGRTRGHRRDDDGTLRIAESAAYMVGPGGVLSTVEDLLLWDRNFHEPKVGTAETVRQLVTSCRLDSGEPTGEAPGLVLDRYRGLAAIHHAGNTAGHGAQIMRFPSERVTIIVLSNIHLDDLDPDALCRAVADIVLADAFSQPAAGTGAENEVAADVATPVDVARHAGTYVLDGDVIDVETGGGGPRIRINGGRARTLLALPDRRFGVAGKTWILGFDAAGDGERTLAFRSGPGARIETFRTPRPVGAEEAEGLVGRYHSDELLVMYEVVAVRGALDVRLPHRAGRRLFRGPLIRLGDDSFTDGRSTYLRFERGASGEVERLVLSDPRVHGIAFEPVR